MVKYYVASWHNSKDVGDGKTPLEIVQMDLNAQLWEAVKHYGKIPKAIYPVGQVSLEAVTKGEPFSLAIMAHFDN